LGDFGVPACFFGNFFRQSGGTRWKRDTFGVFRWTFWVPPVVQFFVRVILVLCRAYMWLLVDLGVPAGFVGYIYRRSGCTGCKRYNLGVFRGTFRVPPVVQSFGIVMGVLFWAKMFMVGNWGGPGQLLW
jgi:hypothetical protein